MEPGVAKGGALCRVRKWVKRAKVNSILKRIICPF